VAKLGKIKSLDEYAKLDVMKSAKKDDLFIVIPKSAIMGRDKDGHIILNKAADVSEDIRKEDMDASGYGQDSGDAMSDDDESNWPSKEESMQHAQNLEKCKGAIMKGAGLDSLADEDEQAPEQQRDESDDAFKARKAAFTKSRSTSTLAKRLDDVPAMIEAAVAKALAGVEGGGGTAVPRKGELVLKNGSQEVPNGDGGKDERTLKQERLEVLKSTRQGFLEKMSSKIKFSDTETIEKQKVADEIMRLETELMARA
jgi:hypothetical protein